MRNSMLLWQVLESFLMNRPVLLSFRAGAGATFGVTDLVRLGCSDARAKAVINCLSKLNKVELQSVAGGTSVCRLKC
jgi:hypothetical protein